MVRPQDPSLQTAQSQTAASQGMSPDTQPCTSAAGAHCWTLPEHAAVFGHPCSKAAPDIHAAMCLRMLLEGEGWERGGM
jgi:hypothetical protein